MFYFLRAESVSALGIRVSWQHSKLFDEFDVFFLVEREFDTVRGSFLGSLPKSRAATFSFGMSVSASAWNKSAPTGRILIKMWRLKIFGEIWPENSSFIRIWQEKGHFMWSPVYIYDSILVKYSTSKLRNVSDKLCRENRNILYSLTFFFFRK